MSDPELIARVLIADDRAAFGELVQRHQSAVRQFLRHLTHGDAAHADDLAQETFVQAWRSLARYRGGASFRTWLLGIAHNYWRNARRRERAHAPLDGVENESALTVASSGPASELRQDVSAALQQLDPDEQLVLHAHFQQGLSHGEIAALLDWPLGTVKTHLNRSKAKLRQLLAAWNPQT